MSRPSATWVTAPGNITTLRTGTTSSTSAGRVGPLSWLTGRRFSSDILHPDEGSRGTDEYLGAVARAFKERHRRGRLRVENRTDDAGHGAAISTFPGRRPAVRS